MIFCLGLFMFLGFNPHALDHRFQFCLQFWAFKNGGAEGLVSPYFLGPFPGSKNNGFRGDPPPNRPKNHRPTNPGRPGQLSSSMPSRRWIVHGCSNNLGAVCSTGTPGCSSFGRQSQRWEINSWGTFQDFMGSIGVE